MKSEWEITRDSLRDRIKQHEERYRLLNLLIDEKIKHTDTKIILQVLVTVLCFLFILYRELG